MQTAPDGDKAPRFYHLVLQRDLLGGWSLVREWGRQGSGGRVLSEHHAERDTAEAAMERLRDEQIRRGYRVVFVQGDPIPE